MLSRNSHRGARRVHVSGLAVTAALGLAVATAAPAAAGPAARPAAPATAERVTGDLMNYAVNATAANRGQTLKVERAVRAAGGAVVASYAEIGAKVSLSAPAVKRRVERLRSAGVIKGFTAVIEPAAVGWTTEAFVELFCTGRTTPAPGVPKA